MTAVAAPPAPIGSSTPATRTVAVADGVFVAVAPIAMLRDLPCPEPDLASIGDLPAWRAAERRAARVLLRRLLASVVPADITGPDAATAPLGVRDRGQPYLVGRPDLAVSLSHSAPLVAVAVRTGGGQVGVDVQVPEPVGENLVRRCCPADADRLLRLPGPARDLAVAWTWSVQEACVKATGAGLAARPWTIPVEPGGVTGHWRGLNWSALRESFAIPLSCAWTRDRTRAPENYGKEPS